MRLLHAIRGVSVLASIYLSIVASATIPTPDLSVVQSQSHNISTNLSLPSTPIDSRFHITGFDRPGTPLAQNSLLMTVVNEMAKLALLDWNGRIGSFRSQRLPRYSDISFSIRTVPPAQRLDIRIAVWGLYAAIDSMRLEGRFEVNEYDLYWDDVKVGVLRFKTVATLQSAMGGQRNESESESLDLMLPTLPSIEDYRPADIAGTLKEDDFVADCHYIVRARPLTFEEVLLPILNALREVAAQPKTSYLDSAFQVPVVGIDSKVLFAGPEGRGISRRATYQYRWVVKALHAMPNFLLTNHRLAEMCMRIIVNGVYVGTGGLDKFDDLASVIVATS